MKGRSAERAQMKTFLSMPWRGAARKQAACCVLALTLLLALAVSSALFAQPPSGQPTGGSPSGSPDGKPQEEDNKLGPSEIFGDFKQSLETTLRDIKHRDPEKETFHFVVLFNSANTEGVSAHEMRKIYHDLLTRYLIESPEGSDKVSFVPFQLTVRQSQAIWDQPFTRQTAQNLYKFPDSPEATPGLIGGNDVEGAVLEAAREIKKQYPADFDASVFIVLSNSEVSQHPGKPDGSVADYTLTVDKPDFSQQMKSLGLAQADPGGQAIKGQAILVGTRPDGTRVETPVYWRIYVPAEFKCLTQLSTLRRSQLIGQGPAAPPPPIDPNHGRTPPPIKNNTSSQETTESAVNPAPYIIGLLLAGAGIGYLWWISKPRRLRIGLITDGETPVYGNPFDLKIRHPLYIRGSSEEGAVAVSGLPAAINVAQLSLNYTGAVVLTGEAWDVEDAPVNIGHDPTDIRVTPSGATANQPGTTMYALRVERAN